MLLPIRKKNHALAELVRRFNDCPDRFHSNSPTNRALLMYLELVPRKFAISANDCVFRRPRNLF